jgi:large subunit ribosomal protein L23
MSEFNRYAFLVDRRARKDEIKAAIEELYNVRVTGVATQNRKGRTKRTRFGYVEEPTTKKAVVSVHEDDAIELF